MQNPIISQFVPHSLPVCGLDVLEVVNVLLVVNLVLVDLVSEHAHRVPDRDMKV